MRPRRHAEHHLIGRIGWLRAAVLGANDGILSTLFTHISRLRSKLNAGFDSDVIQTVRGSGYLIDG